MVSYLRSKNESFPLVKAIVGVHVSYNLMEQELFWLVELCEGFPDLLCMRMLRNKQLLTSGKIVCLTSI